MPRPSQEEKILQAALHVFATNGYEGTRVKHIAEAAEVSEGALYKHYPSKEAVAVALFTRYMQEYVEQLLAVAAEATPVQARLQEIIVMSFATYRANPDAIHYILLERPHLMEQMPAGFIYPIDVLARLMQAGQASGVIRAGAPLLLAAIFFGCLLRPLIVARSGDLHGLDLLHDPAHEEVIKEAAWAAVAHEHTTSPEKPRSFA